MKETRIRNYKLSNRCCSFPGVIVLPQSCSLVLVPKSKCSSLVLNRCSAQLRTHTHRSSIVTMSATNTGGKRATKTATQPPPFWKNLVAGGGAGIMEIACMYPTDVAKTRQQLMGGQTNSMFAIFRDIVKNEGPTNLYRGVMSPMMAEAPKRAIKFGLNETYKNMLRKDDGSLPALRAGAAGSMAGMAECSVNTPFEVVKVQMQAKENLGRYKGVVDCVVSLVRAEGPFALYKGLESQLWRNAVWNGVYFGMIGWIKTSLFPAPPGADKITKRGYDFNAGLISGTLATLANTPFDVVKSRMQNQLRVEGQVPKYRLTIPSLVTVASEEGLQALYKGIGPRLVRLGPGGGIMLVAFNGILDLLQSY